MMKKKTIIEHAKEKAQHYYQDKDGMYGKHWLTWLPELSNHELSVSFLMLA